MRSLAAVVSVSVLRFVLSWHKVGKFKARLAFLLPSTSVRHFPGIHVEIIFRLFGKELMEKVPKQ